jgi:5-methylcytosine-specific restriction enzyme B
LKAAQSLRESLFSGESVLLPDHIKPWAGILHDSWPIDAGLLPDENAVATAVQCGAALGKKYGLAWVMFCRPDGASRREIAAACGAPQFNAAKQAQQAGKLDFMTGEREGRGKVYFMGSPGSHPGGPNVVQAEEDDDEDLSFPKNLVLYGPPGTGKTFATVELVLEILDRAYLQAHREDRGLLKKRFDALVEAADVRFITFHQSFSYEDFVEGLRADRGDDGQLQYVVEDGVFKSLCTAAAARITQQTEVPTAPIADTAFKIGEKFGKYEVRYASSDIVELTKPNGKRLPIGMSIIRELADSVSEGKLTLADIKERHVFEKLPETLLDPFLVGGFDNILAPLVERLLKGGPSSAQPAADRKESPKVLIIDEINRGNVSRIFGELITLIEPSKRAGASEALEVTLPYSKRRFSVPDNLYIIGTMNTADRSLTGLDIALRRRFVFREMLPQPALLAGTNVLGVDIGKLLSIINDRIEALLDRDHRLGHAYFLPLLEDPSLDRLSSIFRHQIIPLLQEYFFEDWSRIQLVLNDHRKSSPNRFLQQPKADLTNLFGEQNLASDRNERWIINDDAFSRIEAYLGIIDHQTPALAIESDRQAVHGDLTIKQLASGTIEVWKNGERLETAIQPLRAIAKELGVETSWKTGTPLNTRHLGAKVISTLGKGTA